MSRRLLVWSLVAGFLLLTPSIARAQATLAGVVRDTSGGVLPGVTVEASSPALIEKVRSVVTDGSGQYRFTELPPGTYDLTFTLTGFNVSRRESVQVAGTGVIAINAEMRVGALQETITVTGETPVVDTQSTRRETVIDDSVINALPATRTYGAVLNAIPGLMTNTGSTGAMVTPDMTFFTAHGGRQNEGQVQIDGMPVAASFNGGGVSTFTYDIANAEEMQVLVSGGLGEQENGGPRMNLVPRSGGNTFRGSAFYSGAGSWSTGNNIDADLIAAQITAPPEIVSLYDLSGSLGGPVVRDRLWFFGNLRRYANYQIIEGVFGNRNAGTTSWDYAINRDVQARTANSREIFSFRFTAQASARNRVSFSHEYQHRCSGTTLAAGEGCRGPGGDWIGLGTGGGTPSAPEAWPGYHDFPYFVTQATWTNPLSNRVMLEAGVSRFHYLWAGFGQAPPDHLDLIPVTEVQAIDDHRANFSYRGIFDPIAYAYADNDANPNNWRATMSYVTGAHNVKFGYQGSFQRSLQGREANDTLLRYTFNGYKPRVNPTDPLIHNPTGFGFYIAPRWEVNDRTATQSFFVQDQWTMGRLTVQGALRYDRAWSWSPAEHNGTTLVSKFNPVARTFPRTVSVAGYNDITPRIGGAWDIFGTGRTALKVNIGRYLQTATNDENYAINNPAGASRFVTYVPNRAWTDGNNNFVVDCDILNFQQQSTPGGDTCGAVIGPSSNFGSANPTATRVNPEILRGWGVRPADWQVGASIQQEVMPRVSVEVGYYRRWFQNFFVTDNTLVGPADYDRWTYTAPANANLPNAGQPLTFYSIKQEASTRGASQYITFETDYGPARTHYWHGVDVSANARLRNGLLIQGGTSTGRGVRNHCAQAAALPETLIVANVNQQLESCDVTEPWMTSIRGLVSYTVPKIDVQVSANARSVNATNVLPGLVGSTSATNGASLSANIAVPNATCPASMPACQTVSGSLGRIPAGGLAGGTTSVNLLRTGQFYIDERINQVDVRMVKILRFGSRKLDVGFDLYNLFNANDRTAFDQAFDHNTTGATWLRPTAIVNPRFVRFNVTLSY